MLSRGLPGFWSAAVVSVAVVCQVVGSVAAAGQARARSVVGLVPSTWTRTRIGVPAVAVMPGTVMPDRAVASRMRWSCTDPFGLIRSRAP